MLSTALLEITIVMGTLYFDLNSFGVCNEVCSWFNQDFYLQICYVSLMLSYTVCSHSDWRFKLQVIDLRELACLWEVTWYSFWFINCPSVVGLAFCKITTRSIWLKLTCILVMSKCIYYVLLKANHSKIRFQLPSLAIKISRISCIPSIGAIFILEQFCCDKVDGKLKQCWTLVEQMFPMYFFYATYAKIVNICLHKPHHIREFLLISFRK